LVGENQWGKRSLYNALALLLAPQPTLYQLQQHDFYFSAENKQANKLTLRFTFCQRQTDKDYHHYFRHWPAEVDIPTCFCLQVTGHRESDKVSSHYELLSQHLQPLFAPHIDQTALIEQLKQFFPVLSLKAEVNQHDKTHNSTPQRITFNQQIKQALAQAVTVLSFS